jgi:hypothetical protein
MKNNKANNEGLARRSTYFRDRPSFAIIAFMISFMTAALVNTQAGMKQIADVLALFGHGDVLELLPN